MKWFTVLLMSLATLVIGAVVIAGYNIDSTVGHQVPNPTVDAAPSDMHAATPQDLRAFDFNGGTLAGVVDAMQHAWPSLNIVLDLDVATMPVPSMHLPVMNAAGLAALFEQYEVANATGHWSCESMIFTVDPRTKLYHFRGSFYPTRSE